jgi:translation initiation factor 2B subunit (eIF-2B alpha/beta/delta family)
MNKEILKMIKCIEEDRESGASELAVKALNTINYFAKVSKSSNSDEYISELKEVCKRIIRSRASMAALTNLTSYIYYLIINSKITKLNALKKFTISSCDHLLNELYNLKEKIARNFFNSINDKVKILTHSYSSNVINSLIFARNKIAKVYVTESRPLFEGRKTAKILMNNGINVVFIVDYGISNVIKDVDLVTLGCDSILPDGSLVNKLGSYIIALIAKHYKREVFVVTESWKVSTREVLIEEKNPKEVWDIVGIEVKNPYFDVTPAELITSYITEDGRMNLGFVKEKVREFRKYLSLIEY